MIRLILLDIEGTISPIAFVRDVLFAEAKMHLCAFCMNHANHPDVQSAMREIEVLVPDRPPLETLTTWMEQDKKITPLKTLQGMLWQEGFAQGRFVAPLYADVVRVLKQFRQSGLQLAIYSSGSIQAQKMFLAHSNEGDVTPLFDAYFDTTVGPKVTSQSYEAIAGSLRVECDEILFYSDSAAEIEAARAAGCFAFAVARPDNPDAISQDVLRVEQLDVTQLDLACSR